jgi:hypothetical protein
MTWPVHAIAMIPTRHVGRILSSFNIAPGLDLYKQIKDKLQTDEERAFYSFYKVAFESASKSIPAEITRIPIMDVKRAKQELRHLES